MAKIETVKIKADTKTGFALINKPDLTNKHTLFVEIKKPDHPKTQTKKIDGGKK